LTRDRIEKEILKLKNTWKKGRLYQNIPDYSNKKNSKSSKKHKKHLKLLLKTETSKSDMGTTKPNKTKMHKRLLRAQLLPHNT
jgi:hypothetical protein